MMKMKRDPYTKEYQCECCGRWMDEPGICEDCEKDIERAVEEIFLERRRK